MRKKIVAGNWKMNLSLKEVHSLLDGLNELIVENCEVIVCPSFPYLALAKSQLTPALKLGAQNVHQAPEGAFTGEVSAQMLHDLGVQYCIVGHSERRDYFGETDQLVATKITALLEKKIYPIYCCGEKLEVRQNNSHLEYVENQLRTTFKMFHADDIENVILAYEPVWAIGTGMTATPEQANEMHSHIRKVWSNMFGDTAAQNVSILYGGSCKADNAAALFALPDVDGGLIGGASLKINEFKVIVNACK